MSTNKTTNYQLHSWVGTDYVKRTEFNDNFTTIDTTMKALDTAIQGKAETLHAHSNATNSAAGFMSNTDKSKLDGIENGANNYVHPVNHPASIITQDANNRFVTDTEKSNWNAKAATTVATTSANGLMSSTDKSKLDGIASGANNYVHPANHPASIITQDANNRFVTDTEKSNWNAKAATTTATSSADGLMSKTDKAKLDGIAPGAGAPTDSFSTVLAGGVSVKAKNSTDTYEIAAGTNVVVTGDATNNKVTISLGTNVETTSGAQTKANTAETNAKNASTPIAHVGSTGTAHGVATGSVAGFMSAADKTKLDGVATGANNYTHPATHPPSIIVQDASNRFVTDAEKTAWNAKAAATLASTSADGLMSKSDKTKLDGIGTGANVTSVAGKTGIVTLVGTDIPAATTSARGTVQLTDAVNSTSTTTAPTANAVKQAYDLANSAKQKHQLTNDNGSVIQVNNSTDLNTLDTSGFYVVFTTVNAPTNPKAKWDWYYIQVMRHTGTMVKQIAYDLHESKTWHRERNDLGVWSPWSIDLFTSVDNGKWAVRTAILDKGGSVAGSHPNSFVELENGIKGLKIGDYSKGDKLIFGSPTGLPSTASVKNPGDTLATYTLGTNQVLVPGNVNEDRYTYIRDGSGTSFSISKIDNNFKVIWTTQLPTPMGSSMRIKETCQGGYLLALDYYNNILVKIRTSDGAIMWSKTSKSIFTSIYYDDPSTGNGAYGYPSVDIDDSDNIYVGYSMVGYALQKYDKNLNLIWQTSSVLRVRDVTVLRNDMIVCPGTEWTTVPYGGYDKIYCAKADGSRFTSYTIGKYYSNGYYTFYEGHRSDALNNCFYVMENDGNGGYNLRRFAVTSAGDISQTWVIAYLSGAINLKAVVGRGVIQTSWSASSPTYLQAFVPSTGALITPRVTLNNQAQSEYFLVDDTAFAVSGRTVTKKTNSSIAQL